MNEVEKMYENARVEAKNKCKSSQCIVTNPHPDWCNKCESLSKVYPQFTAEKQLELFKLLIRHPKTEIYCRYANDKYKLIMYTEDCCTDDMDSFGNALASVVCNLWGLLSEEERTQIKEILE